MTPYKILFYFSSKNISSLPPELIIHIFSNLDEKSLINAQSTCHAFNNIIQTHRYRMRPSNIGTLDVNIKENDEIEYVKHSVIYTGTFNLTRYLKYKGTTNFKLETPIICNLNINLHNINETLISSLNLSKVNAKKITVKFMCNQSEKTEW